MKIAIMQPYFFPYIGYFQLMSAVDEFVVYDNIEFTKKGWINRNRILVNGKDAYITLPLKNAKDVLDVRDRCLAETWPREKKKILNRIVESYRKAPQFSAVYPWIEKCITSEETNLFKFILGSIVAVKGYLEIKTPLVVSSTIPVDHELKAEKKVMAICKARKSDTYINPLGGVQLYNKEDFKGEGVELFFLKTHDFRYGQFNNDFLPQLSIIDVMMFNPLKVIHEQLFKMELI